MDTCILIITATINLIMTIFIALTAWFTRSAAKATKLNTDAEIFYQILKDYNSEEMRSALKCLGGCYNTLYSVEDINRKCKLSLLSR